MTEYIYLIQTREFIKTKENIYKIGKTTQENLKRICSYPNGTILICQFKCNDCDKLEKELIAHFKEKYELQKDIGYEYFKGNCVDMIDDIYNHIKNENIIKDKEECIHNESDEEIEISGERLNKIEQMFPCYKDDECFGGKKKLVKICIYEGNGGKCLSVYYIDDYKMLCNNTRCIASEGEHKYYYNLIKNKIIVENEIYDMNNQKIISKLINSKIKKTIHSKNISEFIEKFEMYKDKCMCNAPKEYIVDNIILKNCILDDVIYCDYVDDTLYIEFYYISGVDYIKLKKEITIHAETINAETFDNLYLRKYTPYCMKVKGDLYYLYNRDYQIIGINTKNYSIENWEGKTIYFENYTIYHRDKKQFKDYIEIISFEIIIYL
jgi:hypothetical protein